MTETNPTPTTGGQSRMQGEDDFKDVHIALIQLCTKVEFDSWNGSVAKLARLIRERKVDFSLDGGDYWKIYLQSKLFGQPIFEYE
jgi:hypothetical protein